MLKKAAALLAGILMLCTCASCSYDQQEITEEYVQTENGYALKRFEGPSTMASFTVKDAVDGTPVTELQAFSIANAEYLEEIHIGKNISRIDSWALANCPKLRAIHVDAENPWFCSVDGVLFTKDMKTLLVYPNNSHGVTYDWTGGYATHGQYTVPDSVEIINDRAFYKCTGLGAVTFPDHLREIGVRAFTRCENLDNFELPGTLVRIGEDAFSFCSKLTEMYIPASVETIEDYAFFGANAIKKFQMERADGSGMALSSTWLPVKQKESSLINETTPVEWGVRRDQHA